MQYHKMLSAHIPSAGIYGDCWRTAIACILDLHPSKVPHWMQLYPNPEGTDNSTPHPERDTAFESFLRSKGFSHVDVCYHLGDSPLQELWDEISRVQGKDLVYLVTANSPTGPHVVINCGNRMLWDPSPTNRGVVKSIDGYVWVMHLIPAFMRGNFTPPQEIIDPTSFAVHEMLDGSITEDAEGV